MKDKRIFYTQQEFDDMKKQEGLPAYNGYLQRIVALSFAVTKKEHIEVRKFLRSLKPGCKSVYQGCGLSVFGE